MCGGLRLRNTLHVPLATADTRVTATTTATAGQQQEPVLAAAAGPGQVNVQTVTTVTRDTSRDTRRERSRWFRDEQCEGESGGWLGLNGDCSRVTITVWSLLSRLTILWDILIGSRYRVIRKTHVIIKLPPRTQLVPVWKPEPVLFLQMS